MKRTAIFTITLLFAIVAYLFPFSNQPIHANIVFYQNPDSNSVQKLQDQEVEIITSIASNQINLFINNIPEENLLDYGFKSKAEFEKISFDNPIQIYTLQNKNIIFTKTWRVPVVVNNEYRALITIIKEGGEYKAVDFGACVLAQELYSKKTLQTTGLLRVYEIKADFIIEQSKNSQLTFIPIKGDKSNIYDLDDIVNMVNNK